MNNQSIISVPPNVEDPVVLRRFLSRLVEELDVVFGKRGGEDEQYVKKAEIEALIAELEDLINTAKEELEDTVDDAEDEIEIYEPDSIYGVVVGMEQTA